MSASLVPVVPAPADPRPAEDADGAAAEDVHQYLTFSVGGEVYAIGILSIKEILGYSRPTPVPMAPPWIRGVINLRGAVVPLLDLQSRFGQPPSEPGKKSCAVIVEVQAGGQALQIGVVVDAVDQVIDIAPDQVEPPPGFGARIRTDFITGMGKVDGRFVVLLDVDRVLLLDEIAQVAGGRPALAA